MLRPYQLRVFDAHRNLMWTEWFACSSEGEARVRAQEAAAAGSDYELAYEQRVLVRSRGPMVTIAAAAARGRTCAMVSVIPIASPVEG